MSIYGIGKIYDFFGQYRTDKVHKVGMPQVNADVSPILDVSESSTVLTDWIEDSRKRFTDPNEISIGINKNDDFSYIGRDKDIRNLDIRKAISDMQRDSILQDYQYFVGSARNFRSEDGTVLLKQ